MPLVGRCTLVSRDHLYNSLFACGLVKSLDSGLAHSVYDFVLLDLPAVALPSKHIMQHEMTLLMLLKVEGQLFLLLQPDFQWIESKSWFHFFTARKSLTGLELERIGDALGIQCHGVGFSKTATDLDAHSFLVWEGLKDCNLTLIDGIKVSSQPVLFRHEEAGLQFDLTIMRALINVCGS